ncbi:MAG: TlpA family protein disulfide reductase [Chloroflexi bacterium]|nr:TlpA family protein disulfide reductase [Chloroflexota bacterium]
MSPSLRVIVVSSVGVAIAAVLALLAVGLLNKEPVTGRSGITRVGRPAEEFTLPLFGGGELVLSQHLGRPIVINFWASWCLPCRVEAQLLEGAWRLYQDADVLFVGVNIQDSEEDGIAYLAEFGITYPNGRDADGRITVDYGVIGLPVTFFVARDGTVQRRWVGAIHEGDLLARVDELVAGVAPTGELDDENPEEFFKLE